MPASPAQSRRKQPAAVRRALLDAAARLAIAQGLPAVTVQAVAAAAGVTKGGLFHHFPSKAALVESMFADLLDRLDHEVDAQLAGDPASHGRFTRAYVEVLLVGERFGPGSPFDALSVALLAEPSLSRLWGAWLAGRLARHRDTDADPLLEIVRLAVDGAWLATLDRQGPRPDLAALRDRLRALTGGPKAGPPRGELRTPA